MANMFDKELSYVSKELENLKIARAKQSSQLNVTQKQFDLDVTLHYSSAYQMCVNDIAESFYIYSNSGGFLPADNHVSIMTFSMSDEDIAQGRLLNITVAYLGGLSLYMCFYSVRSDRQDDIDETIGGSTKTVTFHLTVTGTDSYDVWM